MVTYSCNKCYKVFDRKSNYETHISKKYPCVPPPNKIQELEEKIIKLEEQMKRLLQKKDEGTL